MSDKPRARAAETVAAIIGDNPQGLSEAGLLAWAQLRIAPDFSIEQLRAALAELGPAVASHERFIGPGDPDAFASARAAGDRLAAEKLPFVASHESHELENELERRTLAEDVTAARAIARLNAAHAAEDAADAANDVSRSAADGPRGVATIKAVPPSSVTILGFEMSRLGLLVVVGSLVNVILLLTVGSVGLVFIALMVENTPGEGPVIATSFLVVVLGIPLLVTDVLGRRLRLPWSRRVVGAYAIIVALPLLVTIIVQSPGPGGVVLGLVVLSLVMGGTLDRRRRMKG